MPPTGPRAARPVLEMMPSASGAQGTRTSRAHLRPSRLDGGRRNRGRGPTAAAGARRPPDAIDAKQANRNTRTENVRTGGGPPYFPILGRHMRSSEAGPFRSLVKAPLLDAPHAPRIQAHDRTDLRPRAGSCRRLNPSRNRRTSRSELSNDRFIAISMASRSSWKDADA